MAGAMMMGRSVRRRRLCCLRWRSQPAIVTKLKNLNSGDQKLGLCAKTSSRGWKRRKVSALLTRRGILSRIDL